VELIKLDNSQLVIRYATNNNLAGRPVYSKQELFSKDPAAIALIKANEKLKKEGYGLLISMDIVHGV